MLSDPRIEELYNRDGATSLILGAFFGELMIRDPEMTNQIMKRLVEMRATSRDRTLAAGISLQIAENVERQMDAAIEQFQPYAVSDAHVAMLADEPARPPADPVQDLLLQEMAATSHLLAALLKVLIEADGTLLARTRAHLVDVAAMLKPHGAASGAMRAIERVDEMVSHTSGARLDEPGALTGGTPA